MRKEKQSIQKRATYWLGVIAVGLTVGVGIQFAQAWTSPTLAPPNGNVMGPITTGNGAQWKEGTLGLGTEGPATAGMRLDVSGNVLANTFYDKDNAAYYLNPAGVSFMNALYTRSASWGLIMQDATGTNNAAAKSSVGSIYANDIFLRSISKWASDLGAGSQPDGLGYGQTWQNVKASRSVGATYTNSTSKPIFVTITGGCGSTGGAGNHMHLLVDGMVVGGWYASFFEGASGGSASAVVPVGSSYSASTNSGSCNVIDGWSELR